VLAVAVATVSVLAVAAGSTGATRERASPPPPPPARVVVGPGDTVWDLAAAHLPAGEDLPSYVAEVVERNRVDATALAPGTVLVLPRR
ncbi:MAG: LysM peptidoglycan-binding domain-containing protein, partial [Actinomycetota bacterium]|nr:LysM peptidoglycan-binding domain-containing protein [Actinomycetota bacterium]